MNVDKERIVKNSLSAHELLRNRGINNIVWKEWEKSLRTLPKTGKKQFEPNESLLQNLQIENGLKNRKGLLNIEKVERYSNLAIAEWLPAQKKAQVIKRSGQDWSIFGHEINRTLLLFPEEALLLLEMNCLELIWNNTALSVQQAYRMLLDDSTCSLEEYRVYSQLTRCGYRIQRFVYNDSEKNVRTDECNKRKVIVDPINGLRMNTSQPAQTNNSNTENSSETDITTPDEGIAQTVQCVINNILLNLENKEESVDSQSNWMCNVQTNEIETIDETLASSNKKTKNSKVEIISDEKLVGGIKIVKEATGGNSNTTISVTRWPGTRILRNVKVLPKRTDKPVYQTTLKPPSVSTVESSLEENGNKCMSKRKSNECENIGTKRSKQEVIELSDEEIEEVPHSMTRMEMLNLFPNIAKKMVIAEQIARQYIPHNINPQKRVYRYERSQLLNTQGKGKGLSLNNSGNKSTFHRNRHAEENQLIPVYNQNLNTNTHNPNVYGVERRQFLDFSSLLYNRLPPSFHQNIYWQNRIYQQNMFQNMLNYVAIQNFHSTIQHNRCLSIQVDNFSNTSIIHRNCSTQNRFQQDVYQNVSLQHRLYQQRSSVNVHHGRGTSRNQSGHSSRQHLHRKPVADKQHFSKPSFTKCPGTSSWKELKKRWCEEKTITIDDDDDSAEKNDMDCNEVEVVQHRIHPLIGPKNTGTLAEVYDRLQIIKPAPEKIFRKKRSSYKISYNVYSSSQHYRKSNPGEPLCRIIVIRQTESLFIQAIDLSRLQQDAASVPIILAHVSMSVSYIQPAVVSLPDFTAHT